MTLGQSIVDESDTHKFLLEKARLLCPIDWAISHLAILIRDPDPMSTSPSESGRPMRLWGRINVRSRQLERFSPAAAFHRNSVQEAQRQATFEFSPSINSWRQLHRPCSNDQSTSDTNQIDQLIVSSYNVLAEFEWPPDASRYPTLISYILSEYAVSDILVLQEVTDHFLPYLLQNADVCKRYQFSTHGPPGRHGIGPLPSLLNIVVLSKFHFSWEYVPFARKHKGTPVLKFMGLHIASRSGAKPLPVVLAACHLTQGLVDGAVVSKRNELLRLFNHLSNHFPDHPWVIAGDFNLATSSFTIDLARRKGQLSFRGYQYLCEIDRMVADHGLHDAWLLTRLRSGVSQDSVNNTQSLEELHEGEQGATFDPLANDLAAKAVGGGLNNRPQRYDRILFNDAFSLKACGFNTFGRTTSQGEPRTTPASDHWGIRCLFRQWDHNDSAVSQPIKAVAVDFRKAPSSLGGIEELKKTLASLGCLPTSQEERERTEALELLKRVLCCAERDQTSHHQCQAIDVVLVPVGSYGLGVWTPESDVDCLCIGNISSKIFFTLALSRLKKARPDGILVLRIVRANNGTMLELSVLGIKFDLQYCTASLVAERYPDIMNHPATDSAFRLPPQTLSKLKPARDLAYLRRSIPDMAKYRLSHLFLKAWAKSKGLYSAKFGLLGGINISVMLVPICKLLAYDGQLVSTADIVTTFFHYYADFNWKERVVFDPLFHSNIKYHRTHREPICLLGWHAPSLNTALSASTPTVNTLSAELAQARDLLSQGLVNWDGILRRGESLSLSELTACSAVDFLHAYKSYIKIDARYWGSSPSKGRKFISWLESRCVMVLVDVNRKAPTLMTRIWPAKFAPEVLEAPDPAGNECHSSYLIGLEWQVGQSTNRTKDQTKVIEQALYSVLQEFESRIRSDSRYFDQKSCWVMASVVSGSNVRNLQLDPQPWSEENAGETDSGEDFNLDEEEIRTDVGEITAAIPKSLDENSMQNDAAVRKTEGSGKLRTAADVMNRLRWDPAMDPSNYMIGYEDRFTGTQEKALEQWKGDQTDEEFIPQHRIMYFKRTSDNTIVWERRKRVDDIFGSGV
ncbi:hypothetical protein QQS21_001149 [Conoideocrella luteorostrata]|uniref:polynucleotide adenylyltransferase n=1 Tax=Conoideocrella luteorostrata TaxID=1105319 RepID=A0AAJ0G2A0_9HYPO|nr:hypothetical protein QQS21_001149 [Conoideocrella luteorostrata]